MRFLLVLALASGFSVFTFGGGLIPVEDFSHGAAYNGMTLSPDGKTVAYVQSVKNDQQIMMRDLDTGKETGIEILVSKSAWNMAIANTGWVSNDRLLFSLRGGASAMDKDGQNYLGLTGWERPPRLDGYGTKFITQGAIHNFYDQKDGMVLMLEYDTRVTVGDMYWYAYNFPNILKINTRTGGFERVLKNPGNVEYWVVDSQGVPRAGLELKNGVSRTLYRRSESSPWLSLPGMEGDVRPLAFSGNNQTLYINKLTPTGRWGVYAYNLQTEQLEVEPIIAHALYDILPNDGRSYLDGVLLQDLIFAPKVGGDLLGVRYHTDYPHVVWFDERMARIQAALDTALPGKVNTVISMDHDLNRLIVLSWASNDPGTYYLFDAKGTKLSKLLQRMPWIDPAKLAETAAIKFQARDGLELHGYLTLPKDRGQKNLPMILMPHDGPRTRDVWTYNSDVQFLANRGYAVLQVNYRGSSGYGDAFLKKGVRKVGTETQYDIIDAANWAIDRGLADPKRMGIMGRNFGGYSALMGAALEPNLYRCVIDIGGMTDWMELTKKEVEIFPISYGPAANLVGHPVNDAEELRSISPRYQAGKIKAPVLLIYGRDDRIVPYRQAKLMADALKKAGVTFELMSEYNEPRGLTDFKSRIKMYQRVDAFLQKHLPAD
ncbi:MAG: S9 family peptidase [Cephaloticoccus sp.]|nr:S9 family peptidase [Cephaloticoccus sp.]